MTRIKLQHQVRRDGHVEVTTTGPVMSRVVKLTLRGQTPQRIARDWQIPVIAVEAIADAHGYPSTKALSHALTDLEDINTVLTIEATARPNAQPADDTEEPTPTPDGTTVYDIGPLLTRASRARKTTLQNAGTRLRRDADQLRSRLDAADQEEARRDAERKAAAEAQRKADEEAARIRDEIARLKNELKTIRAPRIAPRSKAKASTGPGHPCEAPGCDRTFPTRQGASLHHRRVHQGADAT